MTVGTRPYRGPGVGPAPEPGGRNGTPPNMLGGAPAAPAAPGIVERAPPSGDGGITLVQPGGTDIGPNEEAEPMLPSTPPSTFPSPAAPASAAPVAAAAPRSVPTVPVTAAMDCAL